MLEDGAMDDLFKKFAADGLKRDGSIIGGSVRITRLENRNNSDSFQASGMRPVERLRLKISDKIGLTVDAVPFSIRLVIPSTPAAEVLLSFLMKE